MAGGCLPEPSRTSWWGTCGTIWQYCESSIGSSSDRLEHEAVRPARIVVAADVAPGRVRGRGGVLRRRAGQRGRQAGSLGYIGYSDWLERWLGDRNTLPSPFETDRDGDNKVTFAELAARFDLLWTRLDTNKDGVIVRSELLTIRPQAFERERGGRRGRGNDIIGQPQR